MVVVVLAVQNNRQAKRLRCRTLRPNGVMELDGLQRNPLQRVVESSMNHNTPNLQILAVGNQEDQVERLREACVAVQAEFLHVCSPSSIPSR